MLPDPTISVLGLDPAHRRFVLNGNAFQQDALCSLNGWQYACFYAPRSAAEPEPLYVNLARRKLPAGEWDALVFEDYEQTADDGHNTAQIGICSGDGTIHLSYDHHCDRLRYRYSVTGLAQRPDEFKWDKSLFTATISSPPGLEEQEEVLSYVTYPRFCSMGDDLAFTFRTGKAGLGDDHLCVYHASTGTYNYLGVHLKGVQNNPYINGLDWDPASARLITTWVYRGFVWYDGWDDLADTKHKQQRGPNSVENNHNLCLAYSEDGGWTWRNGGGGVVADLGRGESVQLDSEGIVAFDIPKGSGLSNQESQAVDGDGGVHVLNRDKLDGQIVWRHYYRAPNGGWTRRAVPGVKCIFGGKRGRLAVSKGGDLYLLLPDPEAPKLSILKATKASDYAAYEVVWQGDELLGHEPLIDPSRLQYDNVLSVMTRASRSSQSASPGVDVVVLDFQL